MLGVKKRPKVEAAPVEQEDPKVKVIPPDTEGITNQLKEVEQSMDDLVEVCSVCFLKDCYAAPRIYVQASRVRY